MWLGALHFLHIPILYKYFLLKLTIPVLSYYRTHRHIYEEVHTEIEHTWNIKSSRKYTLLSQIPLLQAPL